MHELIPPYDDDDDDSQRCSVCPDFDLCVDCYKGKKHDESHPLTEVPIINPGQQTMVNYYATPALPPMGQRPFMSPPSSSAASTTLPEKPVEEERSRRTASRGSAPHLTDPIQRMEWVLQTNDLGTIPLSQMSTQTANSFMQLYDVGLTAMERHKSGKAHSQIAGRIALSLAGIPRRRPGSFTVHEVSSPLEQETVSGVMSSLITQIQVLDTNGLFTKVRFRFEENTFFAQMPRAHPLRSKFSTSTYDDPAS